ncbi:MAG: Uma2 family endonuclease [Saprospirales bacterium]|nr:Uma2 family endonuclease [Saprospirales bacterium]
MTKKPLLINSLHGFLVLFSKFLHFSGNMDAKKLDKVTVGEYLQIEQESKNRFEYHDGYIFALAGGTLNHGLICGNIFGEIRSGLREKNSS